MRPVVCCLLLCSSFWLRMGVAEEALPRVLILGDSIYSQPVQLVQKELKGHVEVVVPKTEPGVVRNTTYTLAHLDALLGEGEWDLIHFNCGLGDLVYRAPNMKAFRVLPQPVGGVRATNPVDYEKNLNELVMRLKATGAKLVWASTTPIRHSTTEVFELESEIEYNAIAARIMASHGIPINDMYTYVRDLIDMNKPAGHGADPFTTDKKPIHEPIVQGILRGLEMPDPRISGR